MSRLLVSFNYRDLDLTNLHKSEFLAVYIGIAWVMNVSERSQPSHVVAFDNNSLGHNPVTEAKVKFTYVCISVTKWCQ